MYLLYNFTKKSGLLQLLTYLKTNFFILCWKQLSHNFFHPCLSLLQCVVMFEVAHIYLTRMTILLAAKNFIMEMKLSKMHEKRQAKKQPWTRHYKILQHIDILSTGIAIQSKIGDNPKIEGPTKYLYLFELEISTYCWKKI